MTTEGWWVNLEKDTHFFRDIRFSCFLDSVERLSCYTFFAWCFGSNKMIYDKTLHTSLFPCPRYINSEMEKDIISRRCRSKRCRDKREWGMNLFVYSQGTCNSSSLLPLTIHVWEEDAFMKGKKDCRRLRGMLNPCREDNSWITSWWINQRRSASWFWFKIQTLWTLCPLDVKTCLEVTSWFPSGFHCLQVNPQEKHTSSSKLFLHNFLPWIISLFISSSWSLIILWTKENMQQTSHLPFSHFNVRDIWKEKCLKRKRKWRMFVPKIPSRKDIKNKGVKAKQVFFSPLIWNLWKELFFEPGN